MWLWAAGLVACGTDYSAGDPASAGTNCVTTGRLTSACTIPHPTHHDKTSSNSCLLHFIRSYRRGSSVLRVIVFSLGPHTPFVFRGAQYQQEDGIINPH